MEKINPNDQEIFDKFAKILEVQKKQFDLVNQLLPKTTKLFKEVNKVTDQGMKILKFLRWCYSKVLKYFVINIISFFLMPTKNVLSLIVYFVVAQ